MTVDREQTRRDALNLVLAVERHGRLPDLHRCLRLCKPLPSYSAKAPGFHSELTNHAVLGICADSNRCPSSESGLHVDPPVRYA